MRTKSVGIAGCGGLGSSCAMALARVGIGELVLADYDIVEEENLSRQYFFRDQIGKLKTDALRETIHRIDPEIKIHTFDIKLCQSDIVELFGRCDVVVEAFDLPDMKQMIIETVLTTMPEKYIVAGLGLAGMGLTNELRTSSYGRLYVCGDQQSVVTLDNPTLAPRTGLVAHMQANQVMELLFQDHPGINPKIFSNHDQIVT
ncbi:MAG: sulfur carrier protein ThiS adenylyltransferase ThiF [Bacteroidales bacterium]|nr:sulfur carrier protein ThiS adenylyltransferase ThiF [Bacteroidales bacterium]